MYLDKFERCVLKVKSKQPKSCKSKKWKGKGCYNPWAICTKTVGRKSKRKTKRKTKYKRKTKRKTKSKTKSLGKCEKSNLKKYRSRPGPPYPAQNCKNKSKKGNDGEVYRSSPNKNGIFTWKKI